MLTALGDKWDSGDADCRLDFRVAFDSVSVVWHVWPLERHVLRSGEHPAFGANLSAGGDDPYLVENASEAAKIAEQRNAGKYAGATGGTQTIEAPDGMVSTDRVRELTRGLAEKAFTPLRSTTLHNREVDIVLKAFNRHNGNISAVSRELGISRNTVYKKLRARPGSY